MTLRKRFARLAALNVVSNLTVPLAGLVDTAILGHLPDARFLAGVALASILFDYLYWSFGFLRMGTTGLTAQAVGRGDDAEAWRTLLRGLAIAGAVGAALVALQVPLREIGFLLLAGEPAVETAGRAYFGARIWAAPVTLANFAIIGWLLGREASGAVLAITVTANVANALLDGWFILGLGWGAAGAGWATAASQLLAFLVAAALVLRSGPAPAGALRGVLEAPALRGLMSLNRDILIRTVCLMTSFALFTNASSVLGTAVLAGNAVLMRILSLSAYWIDGLAFALESLAGIFRGARDGTSLRRVLRLAMQWGVAFTVPFAVVLWLLPRPFLGLLTSQPETLAVAVAYAAWLVPPLVVGSAAYVYDGLFLGLTAGRVLRNAMVTSLVVGFLPPLAAGLVLRDGRWLWLAMATFMLLRVVTLARASRPLLDLEAAAASGSSSPRATG